MTSNERNETVKRGAIEEDQRSTLPDEEKTLRTSRD